MDRFLSFALSAVFVLAAFFAVALHAEAQSIFIVSPGMTTAPLTVNNGDGLRVLLDAESSYCCQLNAPVDSSRLFFSSNNITITHSTGSVAVTGAFQGNQTPRLANGQGRICFMVPGALTDPQAVFGMSTAGGGAIADVTLECLETTLYGGFNTSVTNFNFLEITNTMTEGISDTRTVSGAVKVVDVVTNPDTVVIDNEPFTVAANTRTDVNIHDRTGAGKFGTIKVTHNAAPGAIKAVLSQYNITSTNPFAFAPVAQEVLTTRSQVLGGRQ